MLFLKRGRWIIGLTFYFDQRAMMCSPTRLRGVQCIIVGEQWGELLLLLYFYDEVKKRKKGIGDETRSNRGSSCTKILFFSSLFIEFARLKPYILKLYILYFHSCPEEEIKLDAVSSSKQLYWYSLLSIEIENEFLSLCFWFIRKTEDSLADATVMQLY